MVEKVVQYGSIPLSGTLTTDFVVGRAKSVALMFPVITSGNAVFQASYDTTSANYFPHKHVVDAADPLVFVENYPVAAGCLTLVVNELAAYSRFRVQTENAQAAVRSFTAIVSY